MSTQAKVFLTPEQYLEIERQAERKSEYWQGEMFAMSGAAESHNLLVMNIAAQIHSQLRTRDCRIYSNDMRVRVSATGLYTYPDIVVVCGVPQFLDGRRDTLLNPTLIIEVLSPSTEAYDRGRKFEHYQSIESLKQYLLVASERVHADLFTRQPGGQWLLTSAGSIEDTLDLESVGCRITLRDSYERVEFSS
ncbi:MAG: Uma2 family endonuclease [Bryobacteraceae bacterium]|jgi:Uma2 family endonuclease